MRVLMVFLCVRGTCLGDHRAQGAHHTSLPVRDESAFAGKRWFVENSPCHELS